MAQLTYERCQQIFINESTSNYRIEHPSFLEIDVEPTISQGILRGTISGIEVTSNRHNTNNGITAAKRVLEAWGRPRYFLGRTDTSSDAFGFQYIVFAKIPSFEEDLSQTSRPLGPIKYGFLSQTD